MMVSFRGLCRPYPFFKTLRWFCFTYPHFCDSSPQAWKLLILPAKCFSRKSISR